MLINLTENSTWANVVGVVPLVVGRRHQLAAAKLSLHEGWNDEKIDVTCRSN